MHDFSPETRLLPGTVAPPPPAEVGTGGAVSLSHVFGVLRRRYRLVLLVAAVGAGAGWYLAYREPPTFQAGAVIRLAGERRQLTGGEENPDPGLGRTTDPLLSLVQLIQSRSVMGAVVDSLGLQLQSWTPGFGTNLIQNLEIDPRVAGDSIVLTFSADRVTGQFGGRQASAPYGQVLPLGAVRFSVASRPGVPAATLNLVPREFAIDWLRGSVLVTPRTGTDVIDVMYVSPSPWLAQQVVNTTVEVFQDLNLQSAREKSRRRREFLEEQLIRTDSNLTRAQGELASFRSRQQLASSETKLAAAQQALIALDARRAEIEADRNTFTTLLQRLDDSNQTSRQEALRALASSPALGNNPAVGSLYQQLNTYRYRLDSMTTGPFPAAETNPDVVQLKSLMRTAENQLTQSVSSHVATLDARIGSLASLRAQSGASIQVLPAMAEEEMRLNSRVQSLQGIGDQLRQEHQRARMAETVEAGDIEIVDLADLPYTPLWATASIKFGLGLFLGLLLGCGLAFVLEAVNTTIRRPEDIETALHLPGLAVIPRLTAGPLPARARLGKPKKSGEQRAENIASTAAAIGTVAQPFSIGTEAFRMLRTSLLWSDGGDRLKTLVVTSAAPGEGKTLTAANLAASFAHDGLGVLLVDCDVRRPKLHGLFHAPRTPGLLDLLAPGKGAGGHGVRSLTYEAEGPGTEETLEHVLRETPIAGLTLLTCGALPTNASNLLSGFRMRSLLDELSRRFDLVILDTPPVLATADAGILGSLADGVLMVVRAGHTDRSAAQRARNQLTNVGSRVIGAVLNDPKGEVSQYGDYYYPYEYAAEKD